MLLDGSVKEFEGFVAWNGVEGDDVIKELLGMLGDTDMISTGDYLVCRVGNEIRVARIIAYKEL